MSALYAGVGICTKMYDGGCTVMLPSVFSNVKLEFSILTFRSFSIVFVSAFVRVCFAIN